MKFTIRAVLSTGLFLTPVLSYAQAGPGRGASEPPKTPQAGAVIDLTGYWVSIVTEDWRFRMVTPKKGDYASIPLSAEGKKVADAWDPAKDERDGDQCKAYGAVGVTREPGRVHISWQNDRTLKVEYDAGTQTRLFHFGTTQPPAGHPQLQGYSVAEWQPAGRGRGGQPAGPGGSLKVITSHLQPGYIRKNGPPYSADATLTEYLSRTQETNGDSWLIVTAILEDSKYLNQPFITSTHFKLEPDASKWNPSPCAAR